jgi:energy-coupling factor transporter transmembrane protein EcfT
MLYRREYRGLFFLASVFISLLPVVFLINHRGEFYWYIPFFGIAGMAAVIVDALERRLPRWSSLGVVAFLAVAWMQYSHETRKANEVVSWQAGVSQEYESFVKQLSNLPQPERGETIHYKSFPRFFSLVTLTSATQVVFHRTDIAVDIVDTFPAACRYCLEYADGSLRTANPFYSRDR